ncbi:glycoside hydrolase family 71 protein [Trichoderma austrokoningii]
MKSIAGAFRRAGLTALAVAAALSSLVNAEIEVRSLEERAASGSRLVFAHFMIGIVGQRTSASDYDADMQRAKAYGIDAFALNIGTDSYTDTQLGYAYQSAANNGMKVFISFDFSYWSTSNGNAVGQKIAQYAGQSAQLQVDGRPFASSFIGDGVNVNDIRSGAGSDVYFVPNFHPNTDTSTIDGALSWGAWDSNGNNRAPSNGVNVTVAENDAAYESWLNGKTYLAPVSAWFNTHFSSKNWVFPSGDLLFTRWNEVLQQGFPMIEIVTWNDYGESHYVGPLSSEHSDDGSSHWANDMPHDGWLDLSKPFIAAYKNGDTNVANYITQDQVIYWYRRNLNSLDCDSTDSLGRPDGYQTLSDTVYVVTLLNSAGSITINSGGNSQTFNAGAGANIFTVNAALGQQTFTLTRNGANVLSGTSLMDITNVCACGLYNFNAYVGTLPAGPSDPLPPDGLAQYTVGLEVTTCQPTPSLGTNPPSSTTNNGGGSSPTPTNCNAGTVAEGESGNFIGLCQFSCSFGYCPPGPCVCTGFGPSTPPATNGRNGCPIAGEPASYDGLCSFTCNHGYCPEGACEYC